MRVFIKTFTGILIAIFFQNSVTAQEPLLVGDCFPDLELPLLPVSGTGSIRVPDSGKKLVLLDYWGTGCSTCIAGFPKLEKLQERYGDRLQIILVNWESPDSTQRFFKRKKLKIPSLPIVSGVSILDSLVPRDFTPWHVWINQQGIVKFITTSSSVTAENMENFFRTGSGNMPQLHAAVIIDKQNLEQQALNAALFHNVQFYSYLAKRMPGTRWKVPRSPVGFADYSASAPPYYQFRKAFSENGKYNFNPSGTVILEALDPEKYIGPSDLSKMDAWNDSTTYNYFLMIPKERKGELYKTAQDDLNRFFNVFASVEQRKIECYALVTTGKGQEFRWNKNSVAHAKDKDTAVYSNVPISKLIGTLRDRFLYNNFSQPVINGTNFTGNIDIRIVKGLVPFDLDTLRRELQVYGLDIVKIFATTDVLVIKEKENK